MRLANVALLASVSILAPLAMADQGGSDSKVESQTCQTAVKRFIQEPNARNYAAIPKPGDDRCWSALSVEQWQGLDHLTIDGNLSAARLLAPQVHRLDGGELEDALRALGQFATHHMNDFLTFSASGALTDHESTDALTMLPLDLEDDFDAQLKEMRARRKAVEQSNVPQSQKRKRAAIASIDRFIADIERARSSVKPYKAQ